MKQEITPFLREAQAKGCPIQVGTDMLFEQIPAYLEFFGFPTTTPEHLRAVAKIAVRCRRAMRIGWCEALQNAPLLEEVGCEFIELPWARDGLEDRETFAAAKKSVQGAPLPASAPLKGPGSPSWSIAPEPSFGHRPRGLPPPRTARLNDLGSHA